MELTCPLNQFVPQISKMMQTMIHGSRDIQIWPVVGGGPDLFGRPASVSAETSRVRSAGEVQSSFGCQTVRNRIRQAMEISEAPISTIQGFMKLEISNRRLAKETADTRLEVH